MMVDWNNKIYTNVIFFANKVMGDLTYGYSWHQALYGDSRHQILIMHLC